MHHPSGVKPRAASPERRAFCCPQAPSCRRDDAAPQGPVFPYTEFFASVAQTEDGAPLTMLLLLLVMPLLLLAGLLGMSRVERRLDGKRPWLRRR